MIRIVVLLVCSVVLFPTSARAGFVISFIAATDDWRTAYSGFQYQDSFEQAGLTIPGTSITLAGNGFSPAQTYATLPHLYDPTVGRNFGAGSFADNLYDGRYMVTNFSYDPARPAGMNWSNDWNVLGTGPARTFTFDFANGLSRFGVGLANFQTGAGGQGPGGLLINGLLQPASLEDMAGPAWAASFQGGHGRNSYLLISANGEDSIRSIGFRWLGSQDGYTFDAMGATLLESPQVTPEPSSLGLCLLGAVCVAGAVRRRSNRPEPLNRL